MAAHGVSLPFSPSRDNDAPQSMMTNVECTNTCAQGISCTDPPREKKRHSKGGRTSVKDINMKDIVLTVGKLGDSNIYKSILELGKRITLVPYTPSAKLISRICSRCVWICVDPKSAQDQLYLRFIKDVVDTKRKDAGSEKVVQDFFTPKMILTGGLKSADRPPELKSYRAIEFSENVNKAINMIEFIQGRYDEQINKVTAVLQDVDGGPYLYVFAQATLVATDSPNYLQRTTLAMKEAFDDAASYPRQLLMQLYRMTNVRVLHEKCEIPKDGGAEKICIEIRPNTIESCLTFKKGCNDGSFAEMIRNHVKVNGHAFIGHINVEVKNEQLERLINYFVPALNKHVNLHPIIQEHGNLTKLEQLVAKYSSSTEVPVPIPKLKISTATMMYQRFLKNQTLTPYAFLKCMKSQGCPHYLESIRTHHGYNAMHLAILAERPDFLKMLFYANMWSVLQQDIVTPLCGPASDTLNAHNGYTPRRLAEALSYKSKGYDVLEEFEKLDKMCLSMCPLMKACLMGSLDYVNKLVETSPYIVQRKDQNGSNCLLYACASGNTKLVAYLIAKHVGRNIQNEDGETALHMAAMFGHIEILQLLAQQKFDIVGKRNNKGMTAVDYCAMNGDIDVLELYQKKGFRINPKALTLASKNKQVKVVELLLGNDDHPARPNEGEDEDGRLALHYEVINGNLEMVRKLIDHDADILKTDKFGKNVLHFLAEYGQGHLLEYLINIATEKDCLKQLLDAKDYFVGKDLLYVVRGKDRGRKAWHWVELRRLSVKGFKTALHSGQIDVANFGKIMKSGFGSGPDEETQSKIKERQQEFLSMNNDQGVPDMTPLHIAVMKDSEQIIKQLLLKGADPNSLDSICATPMHYAAMTGNVRVLGLLEKKEGDINLKTVDGHTPGYVAEENLNSLAANFIQAKPTIEKAKTFLSGPVDDTCIKLGSPSLESRRGEGKNLKRYVIDTLRDLTIDINQVLFDLGSGPILEASDEVSGGQTERLTTYTPTYAPVSDA